jgi:hypothetical protein
MHSVPTLLKGNVSFFKASRRFPEELLAHVTPRVSNLHD